MHKIPDFNKPKYYTQVLDNEVGFLVDENCTMVTEKGDYAHIIFPLIDTPEGVKNFVNKYYEIKESAPKGSVERANAKAMLNLAIGYTQRTNPFVRAFVVHSCNNKIQALIDKDQNNVLFWNTDAIFTRNKRDDIDIGKNIGQFEEVKLNKLVYNGNNYQVDDDLPTYRGVSKHWMKVFAQTHGRPYDLIKDGGKQPDRQNKWIFDSVQIQIVENKIEDFNFITSVQLDNYWDTFRNEEPIIEDDEYIYDEDEIEYDENKEEEIIPLDDHIDDEIDIDNMIQRSQAQTKSLLDKLKIIKKGK